MKVLVKCLCLVIVGVISLLGLGLTHSAVAYDQSFPTVKLRHGYQYNFYDIYNAGANAIGINKVDVTFSEKRGDLNGGVNPGFRETSDIKNVNYVIQPYQSVRIVESSSMYQVLYHPATRATGSQADISVVYDATIYAQNGGTWEGPMHHTEYQPYIVTWCGDGVKDNYTDPTGTPIRETCDPEDSNESGWGTGGCDNSCNPVTAIEPVCNSLTVADNSGQLVHTTNVSCQGTNAEEIIVDCGNGQTQTFAGNLNGSKTVTKSCTYNTAGTYNPVCKVKRDGKTETNQQCTKPVYVTSPNPSITIDKTDANTSDEDGIVGNDTQRVVQGNEAVFRITVRNDGDEDLKNVVVTDPVEPSCNKNIGNLAVGQSHTYTCSKGNTQNAYTNTANVSGVGITSGQNVNDTDPTRVEVVIPRCDSLSVTPNSGTATLNSSFSCYGTNVDTYKIIIKNSNGSVINTINGQDGDYSFTQAGNYTATCLINNETSAGNQSCIKPITVNAAPQPSIKIDKRDANPLDRDNNVGGNDSQTVYKGDKAVFKIRVTNNGNEDLKNIVLSDAQAPACAGSVTLPGVKPSSFMNFSIGGTGNHSDNVLQPGEWFEYTCEKSNTQSGYTNIATVDAVGVNSNNGVDDTDTTPVLIEEATCTGLSVTPDSGTVSFISSFACTGVNVDTYRIVVTDSNGNEVQTFYSNNGQYNFTTEGTYSVKCFMNNETTTESVCKKTVTVNEALNPSITIDKTDANEADNDGQIGNDTQTVKKGEKAVFKIKVTNNGTENLKDTVLTDTLSPACAGNVTLPNTKPSTFSNFTIGGTGDNTNSVLEPGEWFEYTCEKGDTQSNYTNSVTVNANGETSGSGVDATDTSEVLTGIYDLALRKIVLHDTSTFEKGNIVEYEITVYNQGTIDANNVTVTDYIPAGMILNDNSWTQSGNKATRNIGNIKAGQLKSVIITFTLNADTGKIINWAEISSTSDSYVDIDSTPDQDVHNDCHGPQTEVNGNDEIDPTLDWTINQPRPDGKGDANGNGICDTGEDEDDHDPAEFVVGIEEYTCPYIVTGDNTYVINFYTDGTKLLSKEGTFHQQDFELPTTFTEGKYKISLASSDSYAERVNSSQPREQYKVIFDNGQESNSTQDLEDSVISAHWEGVVNEEFMLNAPTTKVKVIHSAYIDNSSYNSVTPVCMLIEKLGGTTGPKIQIEKYSKNDADLDGIVTHRELDDDTQTVNEGEKAVFEIKVTNVGDEDLKDVIVTDTLDGTEYTACNKTIGNLAVGATVVYTCEKSDTQKNYINVAAVTGTGKDSDTAVNDTNDTKVVLNTGNVGPRIEVIKYSNQGADDQDGNQATDQGDDNQKINEGQTAKFNIVVKNTGDEALTNIKVTDALAPNCDKDFGTLILQPGESTQVYSCEVLNTQSGYTNIAEVVAQGVTSETNVSDDDTSTVEIAGVTTYACSTLTASPTSGTIGYASTLTCASNTTGSTYKIEVTDPSGNVVYTVNSTTGAFTPALTNTAYTATCYVDGETTQANTACVQNISASSGGGGGGSLKCDDLTIAKVLTSTGGTVQVECEGSQDHSQAVDCGLGADTRYFYQNNNTGKANFTCTYSNPGNYKIACHVSRANTGGTDLDRGYRTSLSCRETIQIGTSTPFCGNNVREGNEECDGGSSCYPAGHANECTYKGGGGGHTKTCENSLSYYNENPDECQRCEEDSDYWNLHNGEAGSIDDECITYTYPSGGELVFGDKGTALIGHNMDAFKGRDVYVKNVGDEPLKITKKLCVYNSEDQVGRGTDGLTGDEKECGGYIGEIIPGQEVSMTPTGFFGNINEFSGESETTTLKITMDTHKDAYFAEDVEVTIAKPTYVNRGGGHAYVKDNTGAKAISSVHKLAEIVDSSNKDQVNFVATLLGEGDDLTNIDSLTGALQDEATSEGEEYATGAVVVFEDNVASVTIQSVSNLSDFSAYNGIEDVRYMEGKNLKVTSDLFSSITTPTTYIIENGNLDIETDITANKNIAFIVKGGDINIAANVKSLKGTYISIKKGTTGGNITSGASLDKLVVDGSLYGDLTQLIANRTYIAKETDGSISVGTVISYGSNLLNKPAPLVSTFIGEYIESSKVAQ